jgi:hypothetical protein
MFHTKLVEKIKTHISCSIIFPENRVFFLDNAEKYGGAGQVTDDNVIQRMRFACLIIMATDTLSKYVIFIAFPPQQWLRERALILRCA